MHLGSIVDSGVQILASLPNRLANTKCVREAVGVGFEMLFAWDVILHVALALRLCVQHNP